MKKLIGFGTILGVFLIVISTFTAESIPQYGDDPYSCHSQGGYTIATSNPITYSISPSGEFSIEITASGTGVSLVYLSDAKDNDLFSITPASEITDNSANDLDSAANSIRASFSLTGPAEQGEYTLVFVARSGAAMPQLAFIEITVTVGAGATWQQKVMDFIENRLLNHLSIYIGGVAIFCLALGTLLYEIDSQRFVKTHGIMAATSLILTTINVILIFSATEAAVDSFIATPAMIDWGHLIHIVLGVIGYIAGIVAIFTGLSGIRTKKPGYIALITWGINFIYGISPLGWGINF